MYLAVYVKSDYVQASVLFTVDYQPKTSANTIKIKNYAPVGPSFSKQPPEMHDHYKYHR